MDYPHKICQENPQIYHASYKLATPLRNHNKHPRFHYCQVEYLPLTKPKTFTPVFVYVFFCFLCCVNLCMHKHKHKHRRGKKRLSKSDLKNNNVSRRKMKWGGGGVYIIKLEIGI